MNKRKLKELRDIAADIPEIVEKYKVILSGRELLKENAEIKNSVGEEIIPSKKYSIEKVRKVDHYKNVIAAYKKGGINEVGQYQHQVLEHYKKEALEIEGP